jgi:hypothetical protein
MRPHLSHDDQLDLFDTLYAIILKSRAINTMFARPPELSVSLPDDNPVLVRGFIGGVHGIPILRRLDVVWYVLFSRSCLVVYS